MIMIGLPIPSLGTCIEVDLKFVGVSGLEIFFESGHKSLIIRSLRLN